MEDFLINYQSTSWDMNVSLEELIKHNNKCIINREYRKSKHDNCYDGVCIYLKHPSEDIYEAMIGLSDNGFVYLGDGSCKEGQCISAIHGLMELYMNREYIKLLNNNKENKRND